MKKNLIKSIFLLPVTALLFSGCNKSHANVGLLYCAGEPNSFYQVDVVKKELEKKGLSTKLISFSDSNDLAAVLNGNIDKVDTIYIPTDNTCASNVSIIDNVVRTKKVPVFAGEEGICQGCGAITLSISYYNIGVKTGEMAVKVLLGQEDIATLPIAYDENPVKKYNRSFCEAVGVTVPAEYVELSATSGTTSPLPSFQNAANNHYKIGVSQLVTHPALDAATQGFVDAVKAGLGETNVEIDIQNAAGESPNCSVIANNFVAHNVDLIMANATPALQAAANATSTIPVLGTSVTEYGVALGIENFNGVVGRNVSGTSDLAPLATQAQMLADVFSSFMKK